MRELNTEEIERLAAFAFGFVVGLIVIGLVSSLVEEWVIAGDLADRQRVREIVREELAKVSAGWSDLTSETEECSISAAISPQPSEVQVCPSANSRPSIPSTPTKTSTR
jgi:hypothetical protein